MAPANISPTLKLRFVLEASDTETNMNCDLLASVFDPVVVSRASPFSFLPAFICIGQELHRLPRSSFYTISCPSNFQGHNPWIPLHVSTGGLDRVECSQCHQSSLSFFLCGVRFPLPTCIIPLPSETACRCVTRCRIWSTSSTRLHTSRLETDLRLHQPLITSTYAIDHTYIDHHPYIHRPINADHQPKLDPTSMWTDQNQPYLERVDHISYALDIISTWLEYRPHFTIFDRSWQKIS